MDPAAQIVVATSALEVGFDDDRVGAVLQHKAPRGTASFIQRIGRAGRSQEMRPWSIVVLSDYGRDGAPITYKAWVCSNPECGFNIRIDNGEISFGRTIGQSSK